MDWNNVNVYEMGEGAEVGGSFYVEPDQQTGEMGVVASEEVVGMDGIPMDQAPDVVLRTLEGFDSAEGVQVIGILEDGQQMQMMEGMEQMTMNLTPEQIAQLQAQAEQQEREIEQAIIMQGASSEVVVEEHGEEGGSIQIQAVDKSNAGIVGAVPDSPPMLSIPEEGECVNVEVESAIIQDGDDRKEEEGSNGPIPAPLTVETEDKIEEGGDNVEAAAPVDTHEAISSEPKSPMDQSSTSNENVEDISQSNQSSSPDKACGSVNNKGSEAHVTIEEQGSQMEVDGKLSSSNDDEVKAEDMELNSTQQQFEMLPPPPPGTGQTVILDAATGDTVAVYGTPPKASSSQAGRTPQVVSDDEEDERDYVLLNNLPDIENDVIYLSSDEDDEAYKLQIQNARTMQKVKQPVDDSAATYRPRYVSRELLNKRHPKCKGLTFKDIMHQTILEDKIIPDLNEQIIPDKIYHKIRKAGHVIHRAQDGGTIIFSKQANIKMYHSSFSGRFEPVLADPALENYVQEYRKTLLPLWKKRMARRKEVDPSSVIPASIGSTGSSSIGSETDPECLPTDEEESESELMQGSVAAWIIPDAIVSRTPSPEPDFDEPQFITTTHVGSHTIVEGPPPAKKRKQKHQHHEPKPHTDGKIYGKPAFSYSCLIAMALKNSKTGSLPVSEIYKFMCDHFPYFKSAPAGWKNSVRHNLSLNKCFEKIEKPGNNGARKGCLWALNPAKAHKMVEEVTKNSRKDPLTIRRAMSDPENLELIVRGELKRDYSGATVSSDDDVDEEDISEPSTPLTPAQVQARRSRTNSSDLLEGTTAVVTPVVTTVSQVHAALQRSIDHKSQIQLKREEAVELGTIANIQGNYVCHTPTGNGTYTLSFANIGSSSPLTPIIIRRTPPVK